MGVAPVGDTKISADNAKEIYTKWKKGEVELSVSQQKYAESFLSPEEIDQIEYDTGSNKKDAEKRGAEKINTDGADKNATGNAIATTIGNIAAIVITGMAQAKVALFADSFSAAAMGGVAIGGGAAALTSSLLYDNAYKERTNAEKNASETNATIDGYANALIDTMDMMSEDMDTYQAQQEELTLTVNDNTSEMSSLSIQIADMEAAGDTEGAKQLKEQLKACQEMDTSSMEEGLEETSGRLEEYSAANAESTGVSASGQTVSDFLKQGTGLGILAAVNATLLSAATVCLGLTAAGQAPKLAPFFPDATMTPIAKILYGVAAGLFGYASKEMISKTTQEFKCGSAGNDMQGHVNGLYGMQEEQLAYTESTAESFAASDEEAATSQEEAQEKANEAEEKAAKTRPGRIEKEDGKDDDKDDDDKGAGAGAGAGAGTGTGAAA